MDITGILASLKIRQLNPMQKAVERACRENKSVVVLSPTGSGKTLAYLLPLVQNIDANADVPQAVVLVPARELALQIAHVFKSMNTSLRVMSCYGGRPAMDEHRTMRSLKPQVIVGTPGRMNDHLKKGNLEVGSIQMLVIDEFDKCLEFGFQEEMMQVLSGLPALSRRILLSATDCDEIPLFAGIDSAVKLDFSGEGDLEKRLNLYVVRSPEKDKLDTLYRLLCTLGEGSTLVFVNYRESVERVVNYLKTRKFPCDAFHGGMEQPDRERALYKFRNGSCPVLVSTDLASRGLDIPGIDHVVHYHLPLNEESFTHRNGRTARWDASGSSYLILHSEERLPIYLPSDIPEFALAETVPKPIKSQWTTLYIGKGKKDKLNKVDIVGFLCKKGGLASVDIGQIDVNEHNVYVAVKSSKVRQLLSLVRGEKIKGVKTLIEEAK